MPTVDEILSGAKDGKGFPKTEVQICLRLDLISDKKDLLEEQVKRRLKTDSVEKARDNRLGAKATETPEDDPETAEFKQRLEEINEEMLANTLTFHMKGVSTREYNILQSRAGRPRNGNTMDQSIGYNIQNFYESAVARCTYKVTTSSGDEREFGADDWRGLMDMIIDEQFDDLCAGVQKINREAVNRNPTRARS